MKVINFIKREIVLCIALVLAIISSFIIKPDSEYIGYIDFRTLAILLSLMVVMAGFQKIGLFTYIAKSMLGRVRSYTSLLFILVMLCFVSSMFITNDVALITFVPFTIIVLKYLGDKDRDELIITVIVMQTIAANLGSMFTPIGNPQNLYLYGKSQLSLGSFLVLMLPYTFVAFVVLTIWCVIKGTGRKKQQMHGFVIQLDNEAGEEILFLKQGKLKLLIYIVLFILNLLTVARIIPYVYTLLIVCIAVLIIDRKVMLNVDYLLLLTFAGFFIFIGNMGRISAVNQFLSDIIIGREILVAIASSQVISNVPAALLLSDFTDNYETLIVGTNLGGLGTLIASMASLISYKYFVKEMPDKKGLYTRYFTVANIVFLLILSLIVVI